VRARYLGPDRARRARRMVRDRSASGDFCARPSLSTATSRCGDPGCCRPCTAGFREAFRHPHSNAFGYRALLLRIARVVPQGRRRWYRSEFEINRNFRNEGGLHALARVRDGGGIN
jgi:hypothetical protein